MSKIVEWFSSEGEVVRYRPLSARLPEFLAFTARSGAFGGYRDPRPLSLKPGLLKLYEIALQAGRKPEEVGLPPLNAADQTLVCWATLRDPAGASWPPPRRRRSSSPQGPGSAGNRRPATPAGGAGFRRRGAGCRRKPGSDRSGFCSRPMVPVAPAVQAEVRVPVMVPASSPDAAVPASIQDSGGSSVHSGHGGGSSVHSGHGGGSGIQPRRSGGRGRRGVMPLAVAAGVPRSLRRPPLRLRSRRRPRPTATPAP